MFFDFLIHLEKVFNSSPLLGLGASFVAGILVSFSPCILPLVPITLSIVGATSVSSRLRGFSISLIFVLGVSTVYTTLGIIASLLGVFLDKFFLNPFILLFLSAVFIFLGLSLFDIIKLRFFSFSYDYSPKKTLLSIFTLGLISGFALIPCNFPVLGSILSLISLKKDVLYGAVALFLFSLGYGVILIILGTFTSLIRRLPKTGLSLIIARRFLGVILISMGVYFFLKFISLIIR